jgi:hypothetical protein
MSWGRSAVADEGDEDLPSGHTLGGPNSRTDLLVRPQHNVKNGGRAALRVMSVTQ